MILATDIVDGHALLQLLWVSAAAGTALTIVFSLAIVGVTRAATERRADRGATAGAYVLLAVVCGLLVALAMVLAVVVMLNKA